MNLLDEAWIPVRRSSGEQDWITPLQITDSTVVALDARRPDFNGALIQFLIGLVQTTTPMDSEIEWSRWNQNPPTTEELKNWFDPVREAFVFDGDGARFMQDYSLCDDGVGEKDLNTISQLLIDFPGDNALKENKDHFIKRESTKALCKSCAALALFTLQTNAPAGGAGIRTSIRGGGPLTTLVMGSNNFLWELIWLNIKNRSDFLAQHGDSSKVALEFIFPWLRDMKVLQPEGGNLAPIQVNPSHIFWGTPRRIRLNFENTTNGFCDCCDRESEGLVTHYLSRPKGFNYEGGWSHSLSPYYENKPGEMLPLHPQPGGIAYKHWLAWSLGLQGNKKYVQPASIVSYVLESQRLKGQQCRIYAFGYDMDNMKARCWYESVLPLYGLSEKNVEELNAIQREIQRWLEAADLASFYLRGAVKTAWFGDGAEARGDYTFIDTGFWSQTENGFYQLLRSLIEQARSEDEDIIFTPLREQWRDLLIKTAIRLFDVDLVGVAPIAQQNPRRTAEAYNRLCASLRGDKLKETLKLPTAKAEKKSKKSKQDAA